MSSKRDDESIIRHINLARKERTILFSDIVQSTRFWATHGDVRGRLMLDRHNWLLFPIVKKFRGQIIKTIGDSIFATFKNPTQAVQAAIAMQQMLEKERQSSPDFTLKIRIGVHTGDTIVEQHDVFGDTVNIASRIESQGRGSQILMSSHTKDRLEESDFVITARGAFKPKGKNELLEIYECHWNQSPDLLTGLKLPTRLPLIPKQRLEMAFYLLCGLAIFPLLGFLYLRFFLGENEAFALIMLKPVLLVTDYPLTLGLVILSLGSIGYGLSRIKLRTISLRMMRVIKGGFGFFCFFLAAYILFSVIPQNLSPHLHAAQFESRHLFVKTVVEKSVVYSQPDFTSEPLLLVKHGSILLLADVRKIDQIVWNKVLIRREQYGWIPRVLPPEIGVPEKRISLAQKFYFRNMDIYALIIGLIGFIWGWITFRIRPA